MKKFLLYPLALIISIGSMALSCDDTSDLFDITTDLDFTQTININTQGEEFVEIAEFETIDPSDISSYNSIKERIKEIEITRITYKLVNAGEDNSADATLSVLLGYRATGAANYNFFEEEISAELDVEKELNASAADLEAMRTFFLDGTSFDVGAAGTIDNGPLNIDVVFTIYTAITAAP
ncbi:MAG: hypothetical protein ACI9XJ_000194 [Marivirga sp.]|jgi:hypothetical protein